MALGEGKEYVMRRCRIRDERTISVPSSIEYRIPFSRGKEKEKK